jgi:hypothetical protein
MCVCSAGETDARLVEAWLFRRVSAAESIAMLVATISFFSAHARSHCAHRGSRPALRARVRRSLRRRILIVESISELRQLGFITTFIAKEPVMLSAHSGINFWIGNNPTANGYPKMPPGIRATQEGLLKDSITMAEYQTGRKMTRAEVSKFWSAAANAYIRDQPLAWARLILTKFENFWNAYQYDDVSIMNLLREDGVTLPGLRFGFIAALGLAGFLPAVWRFPKARWIGAAVLLHMAAVLTVFITERYRLAAVPGLMILGVAGLWEFWTWLLAGRWPAAALYTVGVGAAAWFVSIPRADFGLWSLDHYKAGIHATELGQSGPRPAKARNSLCLRAGQRGYQLRAWQRLAGSRRSRHG